MWLSYMISTLNDFVIPIEAIANGEREVSIKIKVNGNEHTLDVIGDMPLLWVIRDILKLKGTKFGCGKGLCGACTVHLNGVAMRSCSIPVQGTVGSEITTIEGLSEKGNHIVQKAWLKHNVPQCGYCQVGQIMNAAAFLAINKNPTDKDIANNMRGNLCRCGTYQRIKMAIKDASSGNL